MIDGVDRVDEGFGWLWGRTELVAAGGGKVKIPTLAWRGRGLLSRLRGPVGRGLE